MFFFFFLGGDRPNESRLGLLSELAGTWSCLPGTELCYQPDQRAARSPDKAPSSSAPGAGTWGLTPKLPQPRSGAAGDILVTFGGSQPGAEDPICEDGVLGDAQLTLFEGSSFRAAFRMGMASLYSPCWARTWMETGQGLSGEGSGASLVPKGGTAAPHLAFSTSPSLFGRAP